jgi:hypothetical protein
MSKVQGKLITLEISTDAGVTWKKLICEISSGSDMTRETNKSPLTKCDTATAAQEITPLGYTHAYPLEALLDDSPTTSQVTYTDLLTLFINATKFKVRRQYDNIGSEFYVSADAYLTRLSETSPVDGFIGFSGEITGSGALDITP